MKWKLVEVPDDDIDATWDDAELIGVSIMLSNYCGEPLIEKFNVYYRAWLQMQSAFHIALNRDSDG